MKTIGERIRDFNKEVPEFLLDVKYKRMAENPFSFFRGTCHLFYEDLSENNSFSPSPVSWITGDLHLENFGSYKGDNGLVYFDLNDFNEAILAPLSWEISRMITGIFVAFDSLEIEKREAENVAHLFLKTYSSALAAGKPRYIETKTARGIVRDFLKKSGRRKQKELLKDRIYKSGKELRLHIDGEHLIDVHRDLKERLKDFIKERIKNNLQNFHYLDLAFRIAGTGSVGGERYVFLLEELKREKKYLLLDMKEAAPSSLEKYSLVKQPLWASEAERMYTVQQYMQNNCPSRLGFAFFDGRAFILKCLQPSEDKIDFKLIKERYKDISQVTMDMAILTASAHLRGAARRGAATPDEMVEFGGSHSWQGEIIDFSREYSKQVKDYFQQFKKEFNKNSERKMDVDIF